MSATTCYRVLRDDVLDTMTDELSVALDNSEAIAERPDEDAPVCATCCQPCEMIPYLEHNWFGRDRWSTRYACWTCAELSIEEQDRYQRIIDSVRANADINPFEVQP